MNKPEYPPEYPPDFLTVVNAASTVNAEAARESILDAIGQIYSGIVGLCRFGDRIFGRESSKDVIDWDDLSPELRQMFGEIYLNSASPMTTVDLKFVVTKLLPYATKETT